MKGDAVICNNQTRERGLLSTELAFIMPIMFLFALLGIFFVEVERHSSRAQQAADAAARAASLQRTEADARTAAQAAAVEVCGGVVVIDGWVFTEPREDLFEPGHVTVNLMCTEDFAAFGSLLSSTSRTESGGAAAVIEYWRSTG